MEALAYRIALLRGFAISRGRPSRRGRTYFYIIFHWRRLGQFKRLGICHANELSSIGVKRQSNIKKSYEQDSFKRAIQIRPGAAFTVVAARCSTSRYWPHFSPSKLSFLKAKQNLERQTQLIILYGNHPYYCSSSHPVRGVARLSLQLVVGLLSKRRLGSCRVGRYSSGCF
jgi:hypothetical protein